MPAQDQEKVPLKMQARYAEIVAVTDAICAEHLNTEYAQLCRKMAAALSRKRPSPLERGRVNTWAAGILHAAGQNNFLFDKSQTPHIRADALAQICGVSKSTAGNKAKEIRDLLDISFLDFHWTLPSRMGDNPLAWMVSVDGFIIDARRLPREIQEEAYRKGLIPYVPE